jgi:hypothetical protein
MRCKACHHNMRAVSQAQVPIFLPVLLALAGVGGAGYLVITHLVAIPVAGALAVVGAVGGVLLAAMQKQGWRCEVCGRGEALDSQTEAQLESAERAGEVERLRDQVALELRPQLEDDLRPQIENELRPALAEELRLQIEEELRPTLAEELRGQLEEELVPQLTERIRGELEARLRPEIEARLRAQLAQSARVAQPVPGGRPAAAAPPSARSAPASSPVAPRHAGGSGGFPAHQATPVGQPPPSSTSASGPQPVLSPVGSVTDPHLRAQRRARVIVSDIALYHKDLIAEAVRASDPRKALETVWDEAVRSYNESVSDDVRRTTNYLVDAFDAFIAQKRREA